MSIIWLDANIPEKIDNPVYSQACRLFGGSIIDRTQTAVLPFDYTIVNPIPEYSEVGTYDEIMEKRATELINMGKPINVFWSGGIDSTAAIIALLNAGCKKMNVFSAFPNRLSAISDPRITTIPMGGREYEHVIREILDRGQLLITGELADQCMGSFSIFNYMKNNSLDVSPISDLKAVLEDMIQNPADDLIAFFQPTIDKCPFPVTTVQDWFWWINFTCKWQHVSMRILTSVDFTKQQWDTSIQHFYNTKNHQLWAMNEKNHRELKCSKTRYKEVMLQYIEKSPYESWLLDKEKVPSLNIYPFPIQTLYRREDFTQVTMNLISNRDVIRGQLNEILKP